MAMGLTENIRTSIDGMGQVELSGIKLESADSRLLDVGSLDLDKHVAMQPSAIAYFGAMKKEAARRLDMLKRNKDRWEKKQWALAKAAVISGTTAQWKPTLADIEARFITDNERQIEDWDVKMDKAQEELDTLEAWYEGWRQKSFALTSHVSIDEDERRSGSGSMKGGDNNGNGNGNSTIRSGGIGEKPLPSDKLREIRDIMKRRRGLA
jgi:hypothetical protein